MPRIFAPKEDYTSTQNLINFVNGAAAVKETDTEAVAYYTGLGCDIDYNKHELTALDKLPRAVLDEISLYLGVALVPADGKYEVIRKIEGAISTKFITALTVTSTAHGTTVGNTVLAVTAGGVGTEANEYYYKAAAVAPVALYGDKIDSTWTKMTSGAEAGVKLTTGEYVTVVEAKKATGFIFAAGNVVIASKDS